MSSQQKILGTFAIYYSEVKEPDDFHLDLISRFTHFSSFAIEKQQNEAGLRDSENYRRTLFENSPVGLALCRVDGTLVDINLRYAEIIGRSVEETLQLSYWDITPEKYKDDELIQLESLESTGAYTNYEKEYIHKNGHLVPVRLSGMYLERNGDTFIWSSVENITKQRQNEEALRRSQKMEAVGQLTGGIAHDFNNILGIVLGNLSLLEREVEGNAKALKRIEKIDKAGHRAADLTKQLLSFSRKQDIKVEPTNINHLIQKNNNLICRSLTPEVEMEQYLFEELWLTEISTGDFEDVLLNLMINARDAMPEGGKLTIETSNSILDESYCSQNLGISDGEYVQLIISDSGTGIVSDVLEHIYEPFFTTKPDGEGTGLGLAMVYGFISRSKGHIKVYSEIGIGTTFRLYLPRKKAPSQIITQQIKPNAVLQGGDETILAVDDEEGLLEIVKESLQALGYQVITSRNSQQALEELAKHPEIKLLFSDIVMPGGLNGFDLAEKASKKYPELNILLTSGYSEKALARTSQHSFSDILLTKPYTQAELALEIRAILGKFKPTISKTSKLAQQLNTTTTPNTLSKLFLTGVQSIDDEHKELINLLNRCSQIVDKNTPIELGNILTELMSYTQNHFKSEEALMKECCYPEISVHIQVHKLLIEQVQKKQALLQEGQLTRQEMIDFLTNWWTHHIQTMDLAFASYYKENEG